MKHNKWKVLYEVQGKQGWYQRERLLPYNGHNAREARSVARKLLNVNRLPDETVIIHESEFWIDYH